MKTCLSIEQLRIERSRIVVVWEASMQVAFGEILGLIGANGAGKTSLAHAVMGSIPVARGKLIFEGGDISSDPAYRRALRGFAMVPEGRLVFSAMTVEENLLVGAMALGVHRKERTRDLMEECYRLFPILEERRKQKAGSLSGGEQQMLSIARALMANPRLLILDEPSSGLAPLVVGHVFSVIAALRADHRAVLLIEQNAVQTFRIADRILVMEVGRMVLEGTPQELAANKSVLERYIGGESTK
jgi:branched-chain amino acid transport system ATP-binding protein